MLEGKQILLSLLLYHVFLKKKVVKCYELNNTPLCPHTYTHTNHPPTHIHTSHSHMRAHAHITHACTRTSGRVSVIACNNRCLNSICCFVFTAIIFVIMVVFCLRRCLRRRVSSIKGLNVGAEIEEITEFSFPIRKND